MTRHGRKWNTSVRYVIYVVRLENNLKRNISNTENGVNLASIDLNFIGQSQEDF